MSVVYFISCGPHIKIGTSTNMRSRFASLQTSTVDVLRLLGSIPGDAALERQIHQRLADFRKRGEWFLDCADVREAIVELCGRDVFEMVEEPPQPAPLGDLRDKLSSIMLDTKGRFAAFNSFCLEKCESDRASKLWRVHVAKRHLIVAALSSASRAIQQESDAFDLSDDTDLNSVGRCVASTEMIECQVEMILGDDAWFLEGWEMQPRSNPLFETLNGKPRWASREQAAAAGWVAPPNSFQAQIAPWMKEQSDAA